MSLHSLLLVGTSAVLICVVSAVALWAPKQRRLITVPVLDSFANNRKIGELRIDEAQLPITPEFCFTLGFEALKHSVDANVAAAPYCGAYRLIAIAVTSDADYAGYLAQVGVMPPAGTRSDRG